MASETTSPNESLVSTLFSGKIAKSRRHKNSSECKKFKERKRSPEKSFNDSDSEGDDVDRRQSQKKGKHSNYLLSEKTNDTDFVDMVRNEGQVANDISETKNTTEWSDVPEQQHRKRKNTMHKKVEKEAIANSVIEKDTTECWELIEEYANESDVSLTSVNESSDDFWKCETSTSLIQNEKKVKKRKRKFEPRYKLFKNAIHQLGIFKKVKIEWMLFNQNHEDEVHTLKRIRNKCAIEFLLIFIFCGIGGVIFHSIEGAFEMFHKCGVKRVKRDFLDSLWLKSHHMREDEWKSLARSKLMEFENQLYDAYDAGMTSYSGQKGWSFLNSFIYCVTILTTMGYGHIAPVTTLGRMITIVYSLFGIPLFLILLADYGKLFTRVIKFFWAYVRRLYYTGSCRKVRKTAHVQEVVKGVQLVFDMTKLRKTSTNNKEADPRFLNPTSPVETPALSSYTIDDEFNLPISVAVGILLLYMLSGAALFMVLEKWSFFESFYFVYISVSTIGFGDIVPSSEIPVLLCSLVYFVFGLSLTSMCINVITEKLTDSFRQATAKIGATMGMEITEDTINDIE